MSLHVHDVWTHDYGWFSVFCVCASIFNVGTYIAVEYLPAASCAALEHAAWMLVLPCTSAFIVREKLSFGKWLAIALCLAGSLLSFIWILQENEFDMHSVNECIDNNTGVPKTNVTLKNTTGLPTLTAACELVHATINTSDLNILSENSHSRASLLGCITGVVTP